MRHYSDIKAPPARSSGGADRKKEIKKKLKKEK